MDKALPKAKKELEFEASGNKEFEIKTIIDSAYTANKQMAATKCKASIISFCGRAIQKKKTLRNLHWQLDTFLEIDHHLS